MKVYSVFRNEEFIAAYPTREKALRIVDKLNEKYPDRWYCTDSTTFIGSHEHTVEGDVTFYSKTMDKRWSEVVLEFLAILSKEYGYTIDEFSMAGMVHQARLDSLAKLVDVEDGNDIAAREFIQVNKHVMYWHKWAEKNRANAYTVYEAMKPTSSKKEGDEDE